VRQTRNVTWWEIARKRNTRNSEHQNAVVVPQFDERARWYLSKNRGVQRWVEEEQPSQLVVVGSIVVTKKRATVVSQNMRCTGDMRQAGWDVYRTSKALDTTGVLIF
jgi:hypothetical protein